MNQARGSQSNLQFYKKITKPYGVSGDIVCFCHVSEEGWERRGGKGEGGCGEFSFRVVCQNIIPLSLG